MVALHHALLGASFLALAFAGLRLAAPFAPRGLPRAIAGATFATAAAVAEALALGLVSLGSSPVALALAAFATAVAAARLVPAPELPFASEVASAWRRMTVAERAALGTAIGAAAAWAAWQLRHPAIGFDSVHYHLPEMVLWVQGGQPGSVHDVLPGLPVGYYPLTTEISITWGMGIARSFVPLILWSWCTLALTAVAAWAGLRWLRVPRVVAALGATALCTNIWLLAWQSNGSVTDPPALAWLMACAVLCAMSRERPALMVPAVVAAGLAIGCKTTVIPFTLLSLAIGLWGGRARLRKLPLRGMAFATAAAVLVGLVWYVRNLVVHGSPFWPFVAAPWGDPLPAAIHPVRTSFLQKPLDTLDLVGPSYRDRFAGGIVLIAAGIALAPLAATRRRVLLAAAATATGLLIWMASPLTGITVGPHALPETVFSTTRYLLPVIAAACLALALAGAVESRRRLIAMAGLLAGIVVNLAQTLELGFPVAPSLGVPVGGAVAGAALAAAAAVVAARIPALHSRARHVVPVLAVVGIATLLAVAADGFVERHARTRSGLGAEIAGRLASNPDYADGSQPVATRPAFIAPLAGDRLRHPLEAIPPDATCASLARRARREYLVIYGGPLGGHAPEEVKRCLPRPWFEEPGTAIYAPPAGR